MLTDSTNNLNMGMRCIKYMIFVINFMFVLTGALLILVGLTINTVYDNFSHFMYDHFSAPPSLLIAIGVIILLVSLFGCIGAVKESTAWINVYGILLAFIFILQIAAAISAYSMSGEVSDMLFTNLEAALKDYKDDPYTGDTVDFLQQSLECCGINGPRDWESVFPNNNTGLINVPPSCCATFAEESNKICEKVYEDGCFERLSLLIHQGTALIITGALAVALVQILGIVCAFMLAKTIRQTKTLREARRWQIQQTFAIMADTQYNNYEALPSKVEENKEKLFVQ